MATTEARFWTIPRAVVGSVPRIVPEVEGAERTLTLVGRLVIGSLVTVTWSPGLNLGAVAVKAAPTEVLEVTVTEQEVAVPEQAPDQPVKVEETAGLSVRVTDEPERTFMVQVPVAHVKAGPVTVPVPVPESVTVRV